MMSSAALLVSMVGWWYLFRYRKTKGERIGFPLGTALIWMLIAFSRPVSLWFTGGLTESSESLAEGSPMNLIVGTTLMVLGVLIILNRRVNLGKFLAANKLLIILFVYCLVSSAWSDFPQVTAKRWIRHLGTIVFVLVILTDRRGFQAVTILIRYSAYILLPFSIFLFKYYPHLGRTYHIHSGEGAITGVATGKNGLGLLCMVTSLFLLHEIHREWTSENRNRYKLRGDICLVLVGGWLLFMSNSATSQGVFLIGAFIYFCLVSKSRNAVFLVVRSRPFFLGILGFTLALPIMFIGIGQSGSASKLGAVVDIFGDSETFWGRTVVWQNVVDLMPNHLVGAGYNSFWLGERLQRMWDVYWWHPTQAHNGFVGIYAELGIIGVAILVAFLAQCCQRLFIGLKKNKFAPIQLSFFAGALIYNVTEFAFLGLQPIWFLCLLMVTKLRAFNGPEEHFVRTLSDIPGERMELQHD